MKELAAAIKYMTPVSHEQSFLEKAAQDWQAVAPFVEGASKLAGGAGSAGVIASAAADKTAKLLDGLAQIKLGSVPQIKGFEWSATKATFGSPEHGGVMPGVVWTLPESMFEELGGRITGSLAVSFIPDNGQTRNMIASGDPEPQQQSLLVHAVVFGPDHKEYWAPAQRDFIRLEIAPRLSGTG